MARGGYLRLAAGKQIVLTRRGPTVAEAMARRHRLLERWLTDILGLNWTEAHEEAHRLEHALSPRVEDRLAESLGMPTTCPHGNPIPGMANPGRGPGRFRSTGPRRATTVTVVRITEEAEADRKLLEHLWRSASGPGRASGSRRSRPGPAPITAVTDGRTIVLGLAAAAKIWVYGEVGPPGAGPASTVRCAGVPFSRQPSSTAMAHPEASSGRT